MKDGLLIIDKPAGMTSHDVVARSRKILRTKKIGHTGTLDPFATGVLVLVVGKATRLARFLHADEKEYEAVLRFGFETDTGDLTGEPKETPDKRQLVKKLTDEDVRNVLPHFKGELEQIPPMYSAKKIKGERLYKLAREGKEVEREPVKITILKIVCTGEAGRGEATADFGLRVSCSAGTYIRTLAEDIGRKIGIGCHLASLRRIRAGRFSIDDASTLDELAACDPSDIDLLDKREAVAHLPGIEIGEEFESDIRNGKALDYEGRHAGFVAILSSASGLAAVGEAYPEEGKVRPKIVVI
ncbi:MAG: tRNA pseudouridine(55) synthase TruB [Acidobacteria bacterium]|nr:MAG: tRNA pseudouridine(55) synthase TruB [Acidobacteriota bacterium]REJ99157.1 MAG: tRNA pseudouridine(55) synthase TruB [Acidobacteriota bacterium]REK16122.1 MAG: tRNA pseudouridine(55) synthase TruB [Acidobacteriota bacterium]REK43803.1 MAG: tRNA pseudouridine(55) synthase TruB [Acidobacteriota bacterium]